MARPDNAPPPTPTLFFETVNAYQRTASLKAAIELDVFTAIGVTCPQERVHSLS